ncbi:MAG: hypothetical protein ABI831_23550 [Betaproteobacteria bacterium]
MKIIANRIGMGLQVPDMTMARDVLRLVVTAVLAGTGFALLLALTVLSLTVISPPAAASGSPALASSGPGFADSSVASAPGGQIAAADSSLGIPAAAAASLPPVVTHPGVIDAPAKTGGASSNLLWLVIALVAGVLAFSVASLARRK